MSLISTSETQHEHEDVPPIDAGERLYRRLLLGWYKHGKPDPIPQKAFMPRPWVSEDRPGDYDGLSVNRACLTNIETAATRPDNGQKVNLVEFGVADLHEFGLSIVPKPLKADKSHAVIPELNSLDHREPAKLAIMEERAFALRKRAVLVFAATA